VDAYHREWREYFVPKIFAKAAVTDFDAVPRFDYREEATSAVAARVGVALAALLLPTIVLGAVGLRLLRRFPVV
jgi:ABC-2 type transport system permease protein